MIPQSIPQWVIEYNEKHYPSSAGKAVKILSDKVNEQAILLDIILGELRSGHALMFERDRERRIVQIEQVLGYRPTTTTEKP